MTFCQGTDLHSQGKGEPRVNAAIPRDVKEPLVVTSGFPGRYCTVAPSASSLRPLLSFDKCQDVSHVTPLPLLLVLWEG